MSNRFFPNYSGYVIASKFGVRTHPVTKVKKMHNGIDINASNDGRTGQIDDIMAHTGGTVESVGFGVSSGNYIKIKFKGEKSEPKTLVPVICRKILPDGSLAAEITE